jgi:uncharacterized protein (TIGR02118 family)
VLTVCYGHPADPAAFDAYYASTHRPLTEKIPGLAATRPLRTTICLQFRV